MSICQLIRQEGLPKDFSETVDAFIVPLAERIASWHAGSPRLVGINGGQGTGKSTLAGFLQYLLEHSHGLSTAVLSIDDLYLTRSERRKLAEEVHPLLATRGVPGTHDPALGLRVIEQLMQADAGMRTALPRFDKASDDRLPDEQWPVFRGRAEVVLLEGWCVGARPQAADELEEPINSLERDEDADGRWRRYVNAQLDGPYRPLFDLIDRMIQLVAPGMECIREWRGQQEEKLRKKLAAAGDDTSQLMDATALDRFIAHYQRLTEHQWRDLPRLADAVLKLASDHQITSLRWKADLT